MSDSADVKLFREIAQGSNLFQAAYLAQLAPERKTGLYVPNVETAWLFRDDRGWLRLAG
jgi:hypothetical protein